MGELIKNVVIVSAIVAALAIGATDLAIGWVIPMVVGGGLVIGAVMVALRSPASHASFAPDSFERGGVEMLSISSVRVAGVGGLGLLLVAGLVALEYPLISAVVIAGAIGGLVAGAAMILMRRRRTLPPGRTRHAG